MLFKNADLYNVRGLVSLGDQPGYQISRIPENLRAQMNEGAQRTAFNTCGVEIRFNLIGETANITLQRCPAGDVPVDPAGVAEIWHGPFEGDWTICPRTIGPQPTVITLKRPANLERLRAIARQQSLDFDPALFRIILPYDWPTYLIDIQGDIAPPRPDQVPIRKILSYGSSITHGGGAVRPAESYAMLTAARLGCDLINLGFAGSAQIEPEMADFIASEVDWDLATLEMGINVIGIWSIEQFRERVQTFLHKVACPHPDRWIFCIDLFTFEGDLTGDPKATAFREVVAQTVKGENLPRLVHLDGRSLLKSLAGLTADLVHPSSAGMLEISTWLVEAIQNHTGTAR